MWKNSLKLQLKITRKYKWIWMPTFKYNRQTRAVTPQNYVDGFNLQTFILRHQASTDNFYFWNEHDAYFKCKKRKKENFLRGFQTFLKFIVFLLSGKFATRHWRNYLFIVLKDGPDYIENFAFLCKLSCAHVSIFF